MIVKICHSALKTNLPLLFGFFTFALIGCQNVTYQEQAPEPENLSSDNGQLDLSQFSFEQQKKERDQAANSLLEIKEKRIIIPKEEIKIVASKKNINIASYARTTTNLIGEKIYHRLRLKNETIRKCSHFSTSDDAQRFFLSTGGPQKDIFNLDSDGDGFACKWSPLAFRAIIVQIEAATN